MSLDDFCRCTPSEFAEIFGQWQLAAEQSTRMSWEQARMICWAAVSPYAKKNIRPADVVAFPWDAVQEPAAVDAHMPNLSDEDVKARFEETKRRLGLI